MPTARRRGRWSTALGLVVVMAALPGPAAAQETAAPETRDASGIALVGSAAIQVAPKNEKQAMAVDAALTLAENHRADMGYPWLDTATNTLELSAINARGEKAARDAQATTPISGLPSRVTTAAASIADLDEIGDAATRLIAADVPHADLVYRTEPDQRRNRIVITVSSLNDELMAALASRFGTDLIAVRVKGPIPPAGTSSRDNDHPAFWGGAYFSVGSKACSTGFAWDVGGGVSGMLTGAHCASTGGTVVYPSYPNVGSVRSASEENWRDGSGTQYYTGQSVYRGDVALIRYSSAYASAPKIYMGPPHSSSSAYVARMNPRRAQFGDAACVGGVVTGEWCGMVTDAGINVWYIVDGLGVWARHVSVAGAVGNTCPTHGDSGAPVYQKRSDGKVTAFGILSGSAPVIAYCEVYFTDIWDSYYGLPGVLKTG